MHYAKQDGLCLSMKSMNKLMDSLLKSKDMEYNLFPDDLNDDVDTMECVVYPKGTKPINRMRFSAEARILLQTLTEQFLTMEFTMAQFQAVHAKRKTLMLQDMRAVMQVSNQRSEKLLAQILTSTS